MDQRVSGAWVRQALSADRIPVPRHRSYRGLGAGGFHRLHYCDWGGPDNPQVIICAHGYGRHARDFDGLARDLSRDFRVICPDLSGRGESEWLETATVLSIPQLLSDLNALLSRLDVCQVDWIGTSLGGLLGMVLAGQPGTPVRRLVVSDVGEMAMPSGPHLDGGSSPDFPLRELWNELKCPVLCVPVLDVEAVSEFLSAESVAMTADMRLQRLA